MVVDLGHARGCGSCVDFAPGHVREIDHGDGDLLVCAERLPTAADWACGDFSIPAIFLCLHVGHQRLPTTGARAVQAIEFVATLSKGVLGGFHIAVSQYPVNRVGGVGR